MRVRWTKTHLFQLHSKTAFSDSKSIFLISCKCFRMEGQVIGPMLVNSTPTCYNSSLLPSTFPNLTEITVLHREVGWHFQRKKLSVSLYQMFFETGIMIARVWNEILRDLEGKWRHILRARKAYTALNFFCCFFQVLLHCDTGTLQCFLWPTLLTELPYKDFYYQRPPKYFMANESLNMNKICNINFYTSIWPQSES